MVQVEESSKDRGENGSGLSFMISTTIFQRSARRPLMNAQFLGLSVFKWRSAIWVWKKWYAHAWTSGGRSRNLNREWAGGKPAKMCWIVCLALSSISCAMSLISLVKSLLGIQLRIDDIGIVIPMKWRRWGNENGPFSMFWSWIQGEPMLLLPVLKLSSAVLEIDDCWSLWPEWLATVCKRSMAASERRLL